ncbi:transposase TnpA, ISL3 family [Sulfobacillus acidophilus TPY]|nr:transposase TnpA, ISL3 family [Sulfobacillus acidophilus TPY]
MDPGSADAWKARGSLLQTRRFRCKTCGKTFYENLPGVNARRFMTERLVAWIGPAAIRRPFTHVAQEVGISERTVRDIFHDHVTALEAHRKVETPQWLGLDEIHLIRPRGVVTNVQECTLVDLLVNRNKETVTAYLMRLPHREHVRLVTMDMWRPYKDAVEASLPDATIVIDKFHVLKMANAAVEHVRKQLRDALTPAQRRGLMHDRFVLLKREADLTDREALLLSTWVKNYPVLGEIHRLKEAFFGLYDCGNTAEVRSYFQTWERSLTDQHRIAFAELLTAWANWETHILAYFDHPVTNAYTESLNNLIRATDRLGRGYSFEALRAKMLWTEGVTKTRRRPLERLSPLREQLPPSGNAQFGRPSLQAPTIPCVRVNVGIDMVAISQRLVLDQPNAMHQTVP